MISSKAAIFFFERMLNSDEREAIFNVFGKSRDFTDSQRSMVLCIIDEMKKNNLMLQCDCKNDVPVLNTFNKGCYIRKVSYGGFHSAACPLFLLKSRTT